MKKLILAMIAGLSAMTAAQAAEGIYAGAAVTRASSFGSMATSATKTITGDNNPTGYKLQAGYEWNSGLAIEGGYADLGTSKINYSIGGVAGTTTGRQDAEQRSFYLAAKQGFQINELFSVYGKVGASQNRYKVAGVSDDHTGLFLGLGGAYSLTKNVALTVEADSYGKNSAGKRANTLSLGARYSF